MLKPCPFCGDQDVTIDPLNYTSGRPGRFRVQCLQCGASTQWFYTEARASSAWNIRQCPDKGNTIENIFVFNADNFIYNSLLYQRISKTGYCYAQKEFRGDMKRISKSEFLLKAEEAVSKQLERKNAEVAETLRKAKG
jgi:Lar family restriction alleviation protein